MESLFFRTTHMLSLPSVNFNALMSKWSYAIYTLLRFVAQAVVLTLLFAVLQGVSYYFAQSSPIHVLEIFQKVIANPVFQILLLVLIFINGRTVLFRLDDKEVFQ